MEIVKLIENASDPNNYPKGEPLVRWEGLRRLEGPYADVFAGPAPARCSPEFVRHDALRSWRDDVLAAFGPPFRLYLALLLLQLLERGLAAVVVQQRRNLRHGNLPVDLFLHRPISNCVVSYLYPSIG
ncbi:MAG: hypothetical protein HGA90_06340 [Alphaproteobacteria bacterium]|nr:hypothetical protein [Alphaproteobacteria bacterium]